MRIAFISTMWSTPWGGSEELWRSAASDALDRGDEVGIFTIRHDTVPGAIDQLVARGAKLFTRPMEGGSRTRRLITRARAPVQSVLDFAPDVVCVSQGETYDCARGWTWRLLQRLQDSGTPYVLLCHCPTDQLALDDWTRTWAVKMFLGAQRVCFLGEVLRREAEMQLAERIPNACIFRNPVNLKQTKIVPWPAEDLIQFAFVGRLDIWAKTPQVAISCFSDERWNQRSWSLSLIGAQGAWTDYVTRLIQMYGLTDRVRFCGHLTDIDEVWRDHHVLVMPSRTEGVPLAMVEAMLCGRVVVMTDVGAISEWIDDGRNGFIAEGRNVRSFDRALQRAWQQRSEWPEIGQRAHATAMQMMGDDPAGQLLAVLEAAAATAGCPR